MWSRAAVLDRSLPEPAPAAQQSSNLPNITAHVLWESFASIIVWEHEGSSCYSDGERQLTDLDVVKIHSPHASSLDRIAGACTEAKSSCVMVGRGDHALLMCMKADARAYFKAIATVHKTRPFTQAPDVKRDVTLGARVLRRDVLSMFLQLQVNAMIGAGWFMRPCVEATPCLVKPDGADPAGPIHHLKASLSVLDDGGGVCLELNVERHVGTLVDLNRMLDGALRREWESSRSSAAAAGQDSSLVRGSAPHHCHIATNGDLSYCCTCSLPHTQAMETCRHCALDKAISARVACDPCKHCATHVASPTGTAAHNCTVNFNADGSLWACVPSQCLLAGGRDEPLPPSRMTDVMKDLSGLAAQASTWMCAGEPELKIPATIAQEVGKGTEVSRSTVQRKRHAPPLISSLLREMLNAVKAEQDFEDSTGLQKPPNRKLSCTQGFAALTGQKPKLPKPPNKGAQAVKKAPAGTSKGSKANPVAKATTKTAAVKRKPNADSAAKAVATCGPASTAADAKLQPGTCKAPDTSAAIPASGNTDAANKEPVSGMSKADAPTKRRKVSDINVDESKAKVKAAIAAGTLAKLSVPELKVYLKSIGKPVGGKKSDLLERIQTSNEP